MPAFDQDLINGARAVAAIVIRQAVDSTTASLSSTTSMTSTGTSTGTSTSATSTGSGTTTSSAPTSTGTGTGGSGDDGGHANSPLLFFVALGFGVVFTNLWIIVGVKYCFRYNARNRQMRGLDENGEPINLENMPTRPHRRRREKKLMTMDEVNDKFPMVKYKTWVSERAREGLPTAGGVSVSPSRANSIRSADGIVPDLPSKERDSTEEVRNTPPSTADDRTPAIVVDAASRPSSRGSQSNNNNENENENNENTQNNRNSSDVRNTEAKSETTAALARVESDPRTSHDEDADLDGDDEHINAALPPELASTPGDTCAICIDTLEDDDDVRGLTCGHAFHAVCLDPWLTNRRACCPLCKADYYTPKPRPPQAEGEAANASSGPDPARNNDRLNLPMMPSRTLGSWAIRPGDRSNQRIIVIPGRWGPRSASSTDPSRSNERSQRRRRFERTPTENQQNQQSTSPDSGDRNNGGGWLSRVRGRIPQLPTRSTQNAAPETTENAASGGNGSPTTPSQLEAGVQSNTNAPNSSTTPSN